MDLDPGRLTYSSVRTSSKVSKLRLQLASRTVRIAFEALESYSEKQIGQRKLVRADFLENSGLINVLIDRVQLFAEADDAVWIDALSPDLDAAAKEERIAALIAGARVLQADSDREIQRLLQAFFDDVGSRAEVDFSRYEMELDL